MPHHGLRRWLIARARLRRLFSRSAPAWLFSWLPSWGTSLVLHGVALMVLATFFYVSGSRDREKVDLDTSIISLADDGFDSLIPADQAGDPFTTDRTDRTPSLSMEPTDRGIAQPQLSGAAFGPTLAMPDRASGGRDGGLADPIASIRMHAEDMTAPFSGRLGATKAQLVRREGGTAASEKAVQEGLDWLMRHQRGDGGWSLDTRAECKQAPGCPEDVHAVSDTAATGLALLPFLGAGHIQTEPSRYQDQVRRGVDWLIAHQQPTGELFLGGLGNSGMYSHAIATMALCEAYAISKDERLKQPAQRGIDYIAQSQNKYDGGWRYSPGMPGDTSVFGWQMFALRSARLSGLNVPRSVIKGCNHYLDECSSDKLRTRYGYMPGREATPVMSAEALLCRQYLGWPRDFPSMIRGTASVWKDLQDSGERNIYYWYYATQLLHNMQNKNWKQWNVRIRDTLVAMQVPGAGCDRGSWSPLHPTTDRWGRTGGRLFQTSLSVLTLEVYYRFLPLYRNTEEPAGATKL